MMLGCTASSDESRAKDHPTQASDTVYTEQAAMDAFALDPERALLIIDSARMVGNDYERHPSDFHDGNFREPADEDRPDYIDFYRGKAYAYLAVAYSDLEFRIDQRWLLNKLPYYHEKASTISFTVVHFYWFCQRTVRTRINCQSVWNHFIPQSDLIHSR